MKSQRDINVKLAAAGYLLALVRGIVEEPDSVKVEATTDVHGLQLIIHATENDKRFVIGIKAMVLMSIIKIMDMWGRKNKVPVHVSVPRSEKNA